MQDSAAVVPVRDMDECSPVLQLSNHHRAQPSSRHAGQPQQQTYRQPECSKCSGLAGTTVCHEGCKGYERWPSYNPTKHMEAAAIFLCPRCKDACQHSPCTAMTCGTTGCYGSTLLVRTVCRFGLMLPCKVG